MSAESKTCFVISPIGPEDSEVRSDANDFLELLVEPALQKYGFLVSRADKIAHPTAITTDIVRLVQESDLCLIDLTNNNPNVFYECGRRHETGKPFIQMVRKGLESSIPFDVSGIRTVIYDVSTARSAKESVAKLQEFIDNIISVGFQAKTSGDSLSSVAQAVDRVERKVNQLLAAPSRSSISRSEDDEEDDGLLSLIKSPKEVFYNSLKRGRTDLAFEVLPRLKALSDRREYILCLAWVASAGHKGAFDLVDVEFLELLATPGEFDDPSECLQLISEAAKRYFENSGLASDGIDYMGKMFDKVSITTSFNDDSKAFVANKAGMLAWAANKFDLCERFTKMAIALSSEDPAYHYNLALVYEEINRDEDFHSTLKAMSALPTLDGPHIELLRRHGYVTDEQKSRRRDDRS